MKTVTSISWITLAFLLFAGDALAESDREKLIERGKRAYLIYCSNCHGPDATGNGPTAQLLTVPPSDLTLLYRQEDEDFPYGRVYHAIDGRKAVKGHGARDMPIWGDAFGGERAIRINELAHYLETLQKKP